MILPINKLRHIIIINFHCNLKLELRKRQLLNSELKVIKIIPHHILTKNIHSAGGY